MTHYDALRERVAHALSQTKITDLHTHLYSPEFGDLLLWGIDELLNHHYLQAETLRWKPVSIEEFFSLTKKQQADIVWQTLFLDHSPVSAAGLGILDTLKAFGLDANCRDLNKHRVWFEQQDMAAHVTRTFEVSGVESLVMTNTPFEPQEIPVWQSGKAIDPRFHAALRLDSPVVTWGESVPRLREWGYDVEVNLSGKSISETRRFFRDWAERINALYLMLSLPPEWQYPDTSTANRLIDECVLPVCRDLDKPFAMMIGARRQVNPALGLAGDGVGRAEISGLERIIAQNQDVRFLVTMLSRENQYELCVVARKFPNLMIFGCWWFLNIPYMIDEITRLRMELLGTSMIPHHSDVRIMEQVIPKWMHARHITVDVLADKYAAIENSGWKVSDTDIQRDVDDMFGGNFWRFVNP